MPSIQGTITGIHPLGEPLIQSILDYKYGREGSDPVINQFDVELGDLINLQKNLDFPYISTGNLGIEDLIRPFTRSLPALHSYKQLGDLPINRYHYTNTFYRQPTVVDTLPQERSVILEDENTITKKNAYSIEALADHDAKFIIAGPYTFSNMVKLDDNSPYSNIEELILDAAKLLSAELQHLGDNVKQIQLDDPHLVWERVPRALRPTLKQAYEIIKDSVDKEIIVHTYFESAHNIISLLLDLDVDGYGIDFYRTNPLALKDFDFGGKILQAGLIDSQNYVPTDDGQLDSSDTSYLAKIGEAILELGSEKVQIGTTTGLEYVPRNIADQKLQQINAVVTAIQENSL